MSTEYLLTPLTDEDILRIAKHLHISRDHFIANFVVQTNGRMNYAGAPNARAHIKSAAACPFLRQGLCGINSVKPKACQEEKPVPLDARIPCAEWHKARIGWLTEEKEGEINIFPTCGEATFGGEIE